MKKKIITIGVFLVIVILAIVYSLFGVKRNEKLEITQDTNGGVPYKWVYKIEDKDIVKLDKKFSEEENKNLAGGIVHEHYVFKGLKKGTTKVKFSYVSIIDKDLISKEEELTLKVDSRRNVSLVGTLDLRTK